jgi:hypothetical protein
MNKLTGSLKNPHLLKLIILLIVVLLNQKSPAQNSIEHSSPKLCLEFSIENPVLFSSLIFNQNTAGIDTFQALPKPRLLPKRISFMENALWGENGVLRKTGIVSPLTIEERKYELQIRRTMLTSHQIGGFTTLGLMIAASYFGQKRLDGNRKDGDIHQTLVTATIISYSITGLLAILSPPPLIRRDDFSTITLHKTLAWIHFAGMIITPILGSMIRGRHRMLNMDKAHLHQVSGYITTSVLAASMIVVTF